MLTERTHHDSALSTFKRFVNSGRSTLTRLALAGVAVVLISGSLSVANAGSDFTFVRVPGLNLNDTNAKYVKTFELPANVIPERGYLMMRARRVSFTKNSVYLNPAVTVCGDLDNDPNADAQLGNVDKHDGADQFTYYRTVPGDLLQPGTNTLMICSRDENGDNLGNVDNFTVSSIVLHYKVQ